MKNALTKTIGLFLMSGLFSTFAEASCSVLTVVEPANTPAMNAQIVQSLKRRGYLARLVNEESSESTELDVGETFIVTGLGTTSPEFWVELSETHEPFDLTSHLNHLGQYASVIASGSSPTAPGMTSAIQNAIQQLPRCH